MNPPRERDVEGSPACFATRVLEREGRSLCSTYLTFDFVPAVDLDHARRLVETESLEATAGLRRWMQTTASAAGFWAKRALCSHRHFAVGTTMAKATPKFAVACSRAGERYLPPRHTGGAFVAFTLPNGQRWQLDLLNLSASGVCFGLDQGRPALAAGARFDQVIVQVGDVTVEGSLVIAHLTQEFAAGTICGAEFRPATRLDEERLSGLMDRLASPEGE